MPAAEGFEHLARLGARTFLDLRDRANHSAPEGRAVTAAYRIHHGRWPNARALANAQAQGMSFFQFPRKSLVKRFPLPS